MNENQNNNFETKTKPESGVGPIIASIIIILIIVVGAFYLFSTIKEQTSNNKNIPSTEQIETQSDSDEISDIEADLNSTDLENLDLELSAIVSEFE